VCLASGEPGGPRRCSGDTREKYASAASTVARLESSAASLAEGMRQRRELDSEMEIEAVGFVATWLEAQGLKEIRVDDENEHPGRALGVEDDDLDVAISWLPASVIHNPTAPAWNPVVRLCDLKNHLARTPGSARPRGADPDAEHERWLETRYDSEIAAEEAHERARGAVDFEDAWDAADPVHAAGRPLRHAERQAYEEVLADAMRHGYNKSHGDTLDDAVIERRVDEILAAQGLTRAVIEERMNAATRAIR
jgi:hypothetical protein